MKTPNPELESSSFVDKDAQISRTVFKAVRDALSQEVVKVLGEMEKQLTRIFRGVDFKESGLQTRQSIKFTSDEACCKIEGEVKRLFIYLQRVLMINVTQDLCKRLTKTFDEPMNTIMQGGAKRRRFEKKIIDHEERIYDLPEKMQEDKIRINKIAEERYGTNDSLENLSGHIKSFLELTHSATDLLEYVSGKFLDVREENRKLKEIPADEPRIRTDD
jgi:hypothetical protein